jgi:cob(I)alamin adenosyltransferase
VVIAGSRDRSLNSSLKELQRLLFVAGGDAATDMRGASNVPRISDADTKWVEEMTDEVLSKLPKLRNFILPGGTQTGAALQLARAVCRRAERRLLTASKTSEMNQALIPFFNRLSSYLFNLARSVDIKAGKKEEIWKS